MGSITNWTEIGQRVKQLEQDAETTIPSSSWFIVRLDGCSFSNFTRGMKRPFDERFSESMVLTAENLVKKFNCRTAFTQSDEITLLFPACDPEKQQTHLYNGRVEKLCSILASYASVKFNSHIRKHEWEEKFRARIIEGAIFDARVIIPENDTDLLNCFLWRHCFDCSRNAIFAVAYSVFSAKELHKINCKMALDMLKQKGILVDGDNFPKQCLYGTYVKRILVQKMGTNMKTGKEEMCVRTETSRLSIKDPVTLQYLQAKYDGETIARASLDEAQARANATRYR